MRKRLIILLLFGPYAFLTAQNKIFPSDAGLIDVTKSPYSIVVNDGLDDTDKIQQAMWDVLGKDKILYFPNGIYNISKTLYSRQTDLTANNGWRNRLILQGQSRAGTILKLKDNCSGFTSDTIRPMIHTAGSVEIASEGGGNTGFRNSIYDMTIDIGSGNKGAAGVNWNVSNIGTINNVTIRSSDAQKIGAIGIDLRRPYPGPGMIKNVSIEGFNYAIFMGNYQMGFTAEDLTISGQKIAGIKIDLNKLFVRNFTSVNSVPAFLLTTSKTLSWGRFAMLTMINASLTGGVNTNYAIDNVYGFVYARNLKTSGYKTAIRNQGKEVAGANHTEYVSDPIESLFTSPATSLNLPIINTPTYWDSNLANWRAVGPSNGTDDTPAIQAAMNSGKPVVYFSSTTYRIKSTITIKGNVKHIVGNCARFIATASGHDFGSTTAPNPFFRFETPNVGVDTVLMERLYLLDIGAADKAGAIGVEHASAKTVVFKDCELRGGKCNYQSKVPSEGGQVGPVFFENVSAHGYQISSQFRFGNKQKVWARQFNPENGPIPSVYNDGATVWILGLKVEGATTATETRGGGMTEILGGFVYPVNPVDADLPAHINHESSVSFIYDTHYDNNGEIHTVQVRETRDGVTKDLLLSDLPGGLAMPLYVGYKISATGVSAGNDENFIRILPNPVNDVLSVVSRDSKIISIKISDILGKEIMIVKYNSDSDIKLSTSSLRGGIYFLSIGTSNGNYTEKIVVEK